jgi:hypothetical protein
MQRSIEAAMLMNSDSQHPALLGVLSSSYSNAKGIFPGLNPGLAGAMPGEESTSINTSKQPLAQPTAPIDKSTDERLDRPEVLVAELVQETTSLRWINGALRQETDKLRVRVAELEAIVARYSPSIRQSPVNTIDLQKESGLGYPICEILFHQKKRSRYAALFDQMAAASATKTTTGEAFQGKKMTAAPVCEQKHSTGWTSGSDALVLTPRTGASTLVASHGKETQITPVSQGEHPPRYTPLFDALFMGLPIEKEASAGLPTPTSNHCINAWRAELPVYKTPIQPVKPASRFRAFFQEMALRSKTKTSTCEDSHGKEMQACGALHAPRPVHLRAPLLDS